jgi:hypothetical protein
LKVFSCLNFFCSFKKRVDCSQHPFFLCASAQSKEQFYITSFLSKLSLRTCLFFFYYVRSNWGTVCLEIYSKGLLQKSSKIFFHNWNFLKSAKGVMQSRFFRSCPLLFWDKIKKKTGKFFGKKPEKIRKFTKFCKKEWGFRQKVCSLHWSYLLL